MIRVSIPFKRESIYKDAGDLPAYTPIQEVSIPFKRESIYKVPEMISVETVETFQFPSNGKAYTKRPYFAPSWAVAPDTQNQTRTVQGIFFQKIRP